MYLTMPLKSIPFGVIVTQTFDLFRSNYVRLPSQFTLMLKTIATIESFARTLDPDFSIIAALQRFARQSNLRDLEPKRPPPDAATDRAGRPGTWRLACRTT